MGTASARFSQPSISFAQWTLFVAPVVLVLLPIAFFVLQGVGKTEEVSLATARRFLEKRNQQLGKISRREIMTAGILVLTILLWMTLGDRWGLDVIALLGVILTFILGVANWGEVEEDVNWGIFIMYGIVCGLLSARTLYKVAFCQIKFYSGMLPCKNLVITLK